MLTATLRRLSQGAQQKRPVTLTPHEAAEVLEAITVAGKGVKTLADFARNVAKSFGNSNIADDARAALKAVGDAAEGG